MQMQNLAFQEQELKVYFLLLEIALIINLLNSFKFRSFGRMQPSYAYPSIITSAPFLLPSSYHTPDARNYAFVTQFFILTDSSQSAFQPSSFQGESFTFSSQQGATQAAQGEQAGARRGGRKRMANPQRERASARKNSQSNIINHYFNYFSSTHSSRSCLPRLVLALRGHLRDLQPLSACFYNALRIINQHRGKAYINTSTLLDYFKEETLQLRFPNLAEKLVSSKLCTIAELSTILRLSFQLFMMEVSLVSVLTSRRISSLSKRAHLERRRSILQFLSRTT